MKLRSFGRLAVLSCMVGLAACGNAGNGSAATNARTTASHIAHTPVGPSSPSPSAVSSVPEGNIGAYSLGMQSWIRSCMADGVNEGVSIDGDSTTLTELCVRLQTVWDVYGVSDTSPAAVRYALAYLVDQRLLYLQGAKEHIATAADLHDETEQQISQRAQMEEHCRDFYNIPASQSLQQFFESPPQQAAMLHRLTLNLEKQKVGGDGDAVQAAWLKTVLPQHTLVFLNIAPFDVSAALTGLPKPPGSTVECMSQVAYEFSCSTPTP